MEAASSAMKWPYEKFVRAHCLFVTHYSADRWSVYCSKDGTRFGDTFAHGCGETREAAFTEARIKVTRHLAWLETLNMLISEVDNSELPSKNVLGIMLRKKYQKLGRGIVL